MDTDQVATGPNALLHGTDYSFWIIWINGATCHLTRAEGPVNSKTKTIDDPNNTPSWLGLLWGGAWPAGSYTVTATCTASGVGTVTSAPLPITYR